LIAIFHWNPNVTVVLPKMSRFFVTI